MGGGQPGQGERGLKVLVFYGGRLGKYRGSIGVIMFCGEHIIYMTYTHIYIQQTENHGSYRDIEVKIGNGPKS